MTYIFLNNDVGYIFTAVGISCTINVLPHVYLLGSPHCQILSVAKNKASRLELSALYMPTKFVFIASCPSCQIYYVLKDNSKQNRAKCMKYEVI